MNFENSIQKLEMWASKKGFKLSFGATPDQVSFENKIIYVYNKQKKENQVYSLLHECGHILVSQNIEDFEKSYPMYAHASDVTKRQEKTNKYKVSLIGEEFEAWKRGLSLAKRLGIEINKENYDKIMSKCLMTYIKWA